MGRFETEIINTSSNLKKLMDLSGEWIDKVHRCKPPFASYIGYDPQPYIEQLSIPMLYIFAENDKADPTAEAVAYLQTLPAQEGRDIEIRVIPGVEHDMLSAAALLSGSDPAFIDVIGPWAAAKAHERPDEPVSYKPVQCRRRTG